MKRTAVLFMVLFGFQAFSAETTTQTRASTRAFTPGEPSQSFMHITPAMGMTLMSLRGENENTGNDVGLSLGGLFEVGRGEVTFETGLLFNQYGGKTGQTQFNLSYLSIPAVAKWNVFGNPERTLFLKGGFQPSFLVSQEMKTPGSSTRDVGAKTIDFGMLFGIGGAIPVSPRISVMADISYLRGLTNVSDKTTASIRNEGFTFMSGAIFAL